jgi:hypothetical protein
MPSKPKSLSKRVRVRHVSGVEKDVLRSQLDSLSPRWTRVPAKRTTRKKAAAKPATQPSASTSTVPGQPDSDKE